MDNFLLVAKQVAVLFVLIGTGMLCRTTRLVDEFSIRGLVNVLVLIVTPAIIVDCFQRPFDPAMLRQLVFAFAVAAAAHVLAIALAYATARGDARTLPVLRTATVFSNAGFMGIPVEYAILGSRGVFYGVAYIALFNVFMWSWGLREMKTPESGRRKLEWKMLVNPGTVGLAIGMPLFLLSVTLPEVLGKPLHALAELNTPLAMLVIGYYLAGADLLAVVRKPAVYTAAFMRLVAFPLFVLGGLYLLRGTLDRVLSLALLTAASAPVAAMVSMFASKYDRDVDLSVALVSGTTALSILTMPAVLAIAMEVL